MKQKKWAPVSSHAYGANAVYIPEYGKPRTIEIILVMVQNYPEFKTHPTLDVFHGYIKGVERFEENHEMRVLGWEINPNKDQWSFLYLPTMENSVRALVTFSANQVGRMRMEINMQNPSAENRQWEFHLYINQCEGLDLPGYELKSIDSEQCHFNLNNVDMKCHGENIEFRKIEETDSNFWINFPLNAENSEDPCNPNNRYKKRLKLTTRWIDILAGETKHAAIDIYPSSEAEHSPIPEKFELSKIENKELPYKHAVWEAMHNQQYTRSFQAHRQMTFHPVPGRQWGKFFIWDCGLTATGLADVNEKLADEIIMEMPNSEICGDDIFKHGSYIITAVYALWELYRNTGNIEYVKKHYVLLKNLVSHMFDTLPGENYEGMAASIAGGGADDNPASFYAKGEIFAWDYQKTLPTNFDHSRKTLISIGLTAHAIRELKILRNFAFLLGKDNDVAVYTSQIDVVEDNLNKNYWSNEQQCYLDQVVDENKLLNIPWIYDYLPLFSGSVPEDRKTIMFNELVREGGYFTDNGFMIVKPDSPYYRKDGYPNGSAWPPLQYLFWKACYCMGEMDMAKDIAERYFNIFEKNHQESLCCWEQFRAETGNGAGNTRFSGFVTPIVAMHKAHRQFGSIQTSYDVLLKKQNITSGECELVLHSPFYSGETGVSVVLKPATQYIVLINETVNIEVDSDCFGWLGISLNVKSNHEYKIKIINKG